MAEKINLFSRAGRHFIRCGRCRRAYRVGSFALGCSRILLLRELERRGDPCGCPPCDHPRTEREPANDPPWRCCDCGFCFDR